tara:strand:+ start:823 stop:1365 length:543 start_codon:yes stop_codon:yes gene_type:complete
MKSQREKVFVEIGVCDFDTLEPLLKNGWKGYFVEPIPQYADELSHLNISECAISSYNGTMEMYMSKGVNEWSKGISHAVVQQGEKLLEYAGNKELIDRKIEVNCYTLQTYLKRNSITYIDYLKVDVEGHEMDIFEAYNWSVKPMFMKIEHAHIDDIKLSKMFQEQGYITYTERRDMYCVR